MMVARNITFNDDEEYGNSQEFDEMQQSHLSIDERAEKYNFDRNNKNHH